MLRPSPLTSWNKDSHMPQVHPSSHVDETAVLIGDVRIAENVIICPNVVLRADEGSPIIIGADTNIQDGVIMHCLKGSSIVIGTNCSIAHGAVIHGPCKIGHGVFVGFNAVVLNASIGDNSFLSHCAVVTDVKIPASALVPVATAVTSPELVENLAKVSDKQRDFAHEVLEVNWQLRQGYRKLLPTEDLDDEWAG